MSSSSTVDVTSSAVAKAVSAAVANGEKSLSQERLARVEAATRVIRDLKSRGLLNKQKYSASSGADFERRYLTSKSIAVG